ncbi:S8 family serine peptidase [Candidatus Parcubacteria bacterium]|nr:S8 family serine peptidase [Candidatus Parcubacteria bacterium]
MSRLHNRLMGVRWYSNWHHNPIHVLSHWATLFLVIFITYSGLTQSINDAYGLANASSALNGDAGIVIKPTYVQDELLIKVTKSAQASVREGSAQASGIAALQRLDREHKIKDFKAVAKKGINSDTSEPLFRWYKVTFKAPIAPATPPGLSKAAEKHELPVRLQEVIDEIKRDSKVVTVELNYLVHADATPNDPYYSSTGSWGQTWPDLWGLQIINAAGAWSQATGSVSIVVADIDTGVDRNHPDLAANMWVNTKEVPSNGVDDDKNGYVDDYYGWDFNGADNDPMDDMGHGSHTVGTIAGVGNNGVGVVGVNWKAKVMALKFLDKDGSGNLDNGVTALQYAADMGARVSSNSWGCGCNSQVMDDAIKYEHDKGMVVVAAAGNNSVDALDFSPASADDVVTVSATNHLDNRASFSNWGTKIDVGAPGGDSASRGGIDDYILSIKSGDPTASMCTSGNTIGTNYCIVRGTSMAAPHVAGLATLLLAKNPNLTPEEVRQILRTGADDIGTIGKDSDFGYGRINANGSLLLANTHPLAPYISSPRSRGALSGTAVPVTGNITGSNFASYKVELGQGRDPQSWTTIKTSTTQPTTSQTLAIVDTSVLADGAYIVRVTATDTAGKTYQFHVSDLVVKNVNAYITSPTGYVSKKIVTITGTAATLGGVSFGGYTLEAVSNNGAATLIGRGSSPVNDGTLGTWDPSSNADGTPVDLFLTVTTGAGVSTQIKKPVVVDGSIASGWPVSPSAGVLRNSDVMIGDIDGDGKKEVVVPSHTYTNGLPMPVLQAYRYDGSVEPGFPVTLPLLPGAGYGEYYGSIKIMDVNGDGALDIVAVVRSVTASYSPLGDQVMVYGGNGKPLIGFTSITSSDPNWDTQVYLADMNSDGRKDLVLFRQTATGLGLEAYDTSGKALSGFPRTVSKPWPTPFLYVTAPSMVDMDHDGHYEFVIGADQNVYLLDDNLRVLPGWPYKLLSTDTSGVYAYLNYDTKFSSADYFGDGNKEIFFFLNLFFNSNNGGLYQNGNAAVIGLKKDGTYAAGFPRTSTNDGYQIWDYGSGSGELSHADMNGDGADDVVVPSNPEYVYSKGGNYGYQGFNTANATEVHMADVDGDGKLESIFTNFFGEIDIQDDSPSATLPLWRRTTTVWPIGTPLLADLDSDSKLEAIDFIGSSLIVWHLDFGKPSQFEWPMYGQNIFQDNNLRGSGSSTATSTPPLPPPPPAPSPAHIVLSPAAFNFSAVTGATPPAQALSISNSGSTTLNWIASTNQTWCRVSSSGGVAALDVVDVDAIDTTTAASVNVSVDAQSSAGIYTCSVSIRDPNADNSPQSATVTYTVTPTPIPDTSLPTVGITSPTNNATVKKNSNVTIKANATDNIGVSRVEFYVNSALQCTDSATPYTCSWKVPNVGSKSYQLQAKGYDAAGNVGSSDVVNAVVK